MCLVLAYLQLVGRPCISKVRESLHDLSIQLVIDACDDALPGACLQFFFGHVVNPLSSKLNSAFTERASHEVFCLSDAEHWVFMHERPAEDFSD